MRKVLLVLLFLPAFFHAQDTLLIEQKVTTEKMEKEDQKKIAKDAKQKGKDPSQMARDGKKDAKLHYQYKNCGRNITGITSTFSPIIGLVPAIAYSSSPPKDKNLNYPNHLLMDNRKYSEGYRKQAHKMKTRRVWVMFGAGTLSYLVLVIIVGSNN